MKLLNSFFNILNESNNGNGEHLVTIGLNADHVIYNAHFPGKPVTPGVCIIAMVTEVLEKITGKKLKLQTVKNLKFVSIISPLECTSVDIVYQNLESVDKEIKAKGLLKKEDTILTKFSMIYNIDN
ncbi:MAG: beta-hydroxyacyl-ACP dehydratase [Muribaculaceae bacterium]|nr:beta-hydroxyacyl-ACP dehydratase [Muribaculaceae bacterium]